MKTILKFIDEWGLRVITLLTIIIFFKTCTTNSKIKNESDKIQSLNGKIDSLNITINGLSSQLRKEIKIEGLKSEKRMIQSTDRKILDVNRQTEIDKEISNLEK